MNELLRAGAREGGYAGEIEALPNELSALQALLERAKRGDVCAVMTHVERTEIFAWLTDEGFRPLGLERVRQLAVRGSPSADH